MKKLSRGTSSGPSYCCKLLQFPVMSMHTIGPLISFEETRTFMLSSAEGSVHISPSLSAHATFLQFRISYHWDASCPQLLLLRDLPQPYFLWQKASQRGAQIAATANLE
jgi:hypothetical protein